MADAFFGQGYVVARDRLFQIDLAHRRETGRLAEAFRGKLLASFVISDVVGDPPDVIASGPTAADPTTFASYYFRNPQGRLSTDGSACPNPATCGYLDTRNQNLGNVKTSGLDLTAAYRLPTSGLGNFQLNGNVTYLIDYEYQDFVNGPYNRNVGRYVGVGPIFRWQGNATVAWDQGPFGAGITGRYKSGYGDFDPSNHVSSYTIFDLFGTWRPTENLRFTIGVRNLFDRDPPFSNQQETFQDNYDPRFTDPVGRTYYARATLRF